MVRRKARPAFSSGIGSRPVVMTRVSPLPTPARINRGRRTPQNRSAVSGQNGGSSVSSEGGEKKLLHSTRSTSIVIGMVKNSIPSPSYDALEEELDKLYLRRLAVNNLIRSLEKYLEVLQPCGNRGFERTDHQEVRMRQFA